MLLRPRLSNRRIDVLNRGFGGEEAPKECSRIADDVLAENPCLVIWQIGTNCVWQSAADNPPSQKDTIDALERGIDQLKKPGTIDIVLMDLQYVPALITPATIDASNAMAEAIAGVARQKSVNLFRRFDLMRRWNEIGRFSFEQMVNPTDDKRLHQSEWASGMLAFALRDVILDSLRKGGVPVS
ncbi:Lipolytic enzyme GDSL family precursor [Bradyrhizobium sp.]|nr:Lipolytic enzyme GDSL family precursor [Bradyrhizobium sp.]